MVKETFQIFRIDFAQMDYMDGLPWETWRDLKACLDEEGAVSLVMQQLLEGGFNNKRSYKYYPDRSDRDKSKAQFMIDCKEP